MTEKIYVQLFDVNSVWVPTNAQKLGDNQYLILPDHEFDENNFLNLCEFIPGDVVSVEELTFENGSKGIVSKKLIKPSTRSDKKLFDFLFKAALGQIEINKQNLNEYKLVIEKIKQLKSTGKHFYWDVLPTIEQLEQCR
jgi:hypothetical protein